jgi:leader peptidase (prepilin peptidase)/N-methyltransferase
VIGAIAGYLNLWTVYWGFKLATGKEGMGYGDFKLLAALGAWFGWQALPGIILLSSVVGAVVGIGLMVLARRGREVPMPDPTCWRRLLTLLRTPDRRILRLA